MMTHLEDDYFIYLVENDPKSYKETNALMEEDE